MNDAASVFEKKAAQPATPSIFRRNSTKEGQPSKWGTSPSKSGDSQESSVTLKPYIQLISDLFTRLKLFMVSTVECLIFFENCTTDGKKREEVQILKQSTQCL